MQIVEATTDHIYNIQVLSNVIWPATFSNILSQEQISYMMDMMYSTSSLEKQMNDENFRKEYEEMQPEFDVIRAIVDARTSQNLTQKELAERTGIDQADISKLENGTRNPSVSLLKRLAEGMGMVLKIEFIPKQKV